VTRERAIAAIDPGPIDRRAAAINAATPSNICRVSSRFRRNDGSPLWRRTAPARGRERRQHGRGTDLDDVRRLHLGEGAHALDETHGAVT